MHDGNLAESEKKSIKHLAKTIVDQLDSGRPKEDIVRELHDNGWDLDDAKELVERLLSHRPEAAADLQLRYPDMQPTKAGPALFSINGIGTLFYGARDHDPKTGTYVKTWCASIFYIPVFALKAYRVVKASDREAWYVIGNVPLSRVAKAWNLVVICAILGLAGYGIWLNHIDSREYRAKQKMFSADQAAALGDLVKASGLYEEVATSPCTLADDAQTKLMDLSQNAEVTKLSHDETIQLFQCIARSVPLAGAESPVFKRGIVIVRQWAPKAPQDSVRLLSSISRLSRSSACQVLDELCHGPFRNLPGKHALSVYTTALSIATESSARKAVIGQALQWAEVHGKSNPHVVLGITELSVKPDEADVQQLETLRLRALKQIVATDPDNTDMVVRYALLLEKQGKVEEAESLLLPLRDELGNGEGARILGQRLATKGDVNEACAMLSPYVEARLTKLHVAERAFVQAISVAQDQAINRLRTRFASQFDYDKYESAEDSDKEVMVAQFVRQFVKKDDGVILAREKLADAASIVPVALELGIMVLRRARNTPDPAERAAELKAAEKTFLEVQGVAGDNDTFLLNMGQVYYWLGKQDEGQQQLDQLLNKHNRSCDSLVAVADVLHQIGADAEARKLSEEAYDKASDEPSRYAAAQKRVVLSTTLQGRITWLQRCDPTIPQTKAQLQSVRGKQAARQGKDEEAVKYYKEAIAICDTVPESGAILNNSALTCLSLFSLTGSREALGQATVRLEKAVALSPAHPFVLLNAANAFQLSALEELAGSALNPCGVDVADRISSLIFLAVDNTKLEQLRKTLGQNDRMRKSLGYMDKALLLSPREMRTYAILTTIHAFLRDGDALRQLLQQVQNADLEQSYLPEHLKYYRFDPTSEVSKSVPTELTAATKAVSQSKQEGEHTRFAVAVAKLLDASRRLDDVSHVDADSLVRLADAAHQAAPSYGTYTTLQDALLFRASRSLAKEHAQYAQAAEAARRSLGPRYTVTLVLARHDALGQAARNNADVKRATALLLEEHGKFPDSQGILGWARLRAVQPKQAQMVAKHLQHDLVGQLTLKLIAILYPLDAAVACQECWMQVITGQQPDRSRLDRIAEQGAPVPELFLSGIGESQNARE